MAQENKTGLWSFATVSGKGAKYRKVVYSSTFKVWWIFMMTLVLKNNCNTFGYTEF